MEAPQVINTVQEKVSEIMSQRQQPVISQTNQSTPTMIEEAKQLREELIEIKNQIISEREQLDRVHAQALLGGRSLSIQNIELSKEEQAKQTAKEILKLYGK